ncbi:filamentous hemagglutinin N-terminal domain-containing protein [Nostoc parmelioides]|uniref:S-layer family protein n=1 Tax=Nostoc parmelioides FACHB-3921 TaxID=2692909 RepID=A0ABR8BML1_9NOSO|nr:S-layer family protein [Nostoc parmelioides]MBD2254140.1 S-layer family protein [Nostoc parmelioides FACHB-3921]
MKLTIVGLVFIGAILTSAIDNTDVHAQVIPDGSLKTAVTGSNHYRITEGSRVGNNLFHSFSQFSIPSNGSAVFNNVAEIQNIFSRVTGGHISHIDGLIQANGNANFFLLNPAGIIFGQSASLNIGGSFVGTTANSIKFSDGKEFSLTSPNDSNLLSINVPIGLQFGSNPREIQVQGTGNNLTSSNLVFGFYRSSSPTGGLQVGTPATLALIGGDIIIPGGILTAPQGSITLGSIGQNNTSAVVGMQTTPQGWKFNYEQISVFGDINLSQAALLDASSGGAITLTGRNISLANGSLALIQNRGSNTAGDIQVNASGLLSLIGLSANRQVRSGLENQTLSNGNAGNIQIKAADIQIIGSAGILSRSFSTGITGKIDINVTNHIQLREVAENVNGSSIIGTLVFGSGNAGDIQVKANQITLLSGGNINSSSLGLGNGGNLMVDVADTISIAGVNPLTQSASSIGSVSFSRGNSGSVVVNASQLRLRDRGRVTTGGFAQGNAGSVVVNTTESIDISDALSVIDSSIDILPAVTRANFRLPDVPSGNAGSVTIDTKNLRISNQGQVSVRNDGLENAGVLKIRANNIQLFNNGSIAALTKAGEGGNINLQTQNLTLQQDSFISATSGGKGNSGNITIDSAIILGRGNSDIIANASQGRGGNINIITQGIIGLEFRNTLSPRTDSTNDITASSEFNVNGQVEINNIGVDPNSALVELAANLADSSQQIASGCTDNSGSSFVATGRGGIPQNPNQEVRSDRSWSDIRDISAFHAKQPAQALIPKSPQTLVQATGWHRHAQGKVELVAISSITSNPLPLNCTAISQR